MDWLDKLQIESAAGNIVDSLETLHRITGAFAIIGDMTDGEIDVAVQVREEDYKQSGLYETIGKQYGATANQVERCTRHAIKKTCQTRAFKERFGRYFEYLPLPPTNGAFLALVAELLGGDRR